MLRALAVLCLVACGSYQHAARGMIGNAAPRSQLEDSPAVRHRRLTAENTNAQVSAQEKAPLEWSDITVAARSASLFAGSSPSPPPVAQPIASPVAKEPEKLVIEAWLEIQTDDVSKGAAAIRARVESLGGRVVSENVVGSEASASSAALELRVPPAQATGMTAWLATLGDVESKRVLASDVSKTLFDQELELKNLELTMARLQKLAETSGPVQDLLAIEKEMTRVRGEIERVKGEQRWLVDRVEFATITVTLTREGGGVELSPHARIFPGPRLVMLSLLNPGMRPRTRIGGGITVHVNRLLTFDLDAFPAKDGDSRVVLATVGTALYSGYLGFGRRRFFNPYVGARIGYGYLSAAGGFVAAGELGLELFKHRYLLVETAVRALGFLREEGNEAALHVMLGFSVPF